MSTELRIDPAQPHQARQGCLDRIVSSCKRYCYLVPQAGIRMPTACERIRSAFGGFCGGIFIGAFAGGVSSYIAKICEENNIIIPQDLFLKIVFPIISTPPVVGSIRGALHPNRTLLLRAQNFEQLQDDIPLADIKITESNPSPDESPVGTS